MLAQRKLLSLLSSSRLFENATAPPREGSEMSAAISKMGSNVSASRNLDDRREPILLETESCRSLLNSRRELSVRRYRRAF
jgi:hypothetical protein